MAIDKKIGCWRTKDSRASTIVEFAWFHVCLIRKGKLFAVLSNMSSILLYSPDLFLSWRQEACACKLPLRRSCLGRKREKLDVGAEDNERALQLPRTNDYMGVGGKIKIVFFCYISVPD